MTKRADIAARLPICLGLPIPEAAAAIGVSEGHFKKMQDEGLMPLARDVRGVPRIDTVDLERAFRALPYTEPRLPSPQDQGASKPEVVL
jgi:hypothetical protein